MPTLPPKEAKRTDALLQALTEKGVLAPWSTEYGSLNPPPPYAMMHYQLCDEYITTGKGTTVQKIADILYEEAYPCEQRHKALHELLLSKHKIRGNFPFGANESDIEDLTSLYHNFIYFDAGKLDDVSRPLI